MALNDDRVADQMRYKFDRLAQLEHRITAVLDEVLPECWEREKAHERFCEALMWAGSSLNKLTPKDLGIDEG